MTPSPKNHRLFLHLFAALSLLAPFTAAKAASACRFIEEASLATSHRVHSDSLTVDGEINGKPVKMLIGTANWRTYVLRAEAERQNLNPERTQELTHGVGGFSSIFLVRLKDFGIGNARITNKRFPVLDTMGDSDASAIIGADFLSQYDVELHLAENHVKLFRADRCKEKALAYWDKDASSVPMETIADGAGYPRIQVMVDGMPVWAIIDSATARTTIDLETARQLGFSADAPGVTSGGKVTGIGSESRATWNMTFKSFEIGDETVQHPRIAVIDEQHSYARKRYTMVLGLDFLAAHRVLMSQSQMLFYFTYNGGPVFLKDDVGTGKSTSAAL